MMAQRLGCGPDSGLPAHSCIVRADWAAHWSHKCRAIFTHFTPMGWSLQLAGLPRICLDTLALIQHLGWDSTAIVWHKKVHLVRAKRALKRLRRTLLFIAT
jgi:hypothetical protein